MKRDTHFKKWALTLSLTQYIQASIQVPRDFSGLLEEAFLDTGAISITLQDGADQPILEPGVGETPLWDNCVLKALFVADANTNDISSTIIQSFSFASELHWELVEDKDWTQEWKKHFKNDKYYHA